LLCVVISPADGATIGQSDADSGHFRLQIVFFSASGFLRLWLRQCIDPV
jgi:hypothetical protein